MNYPSLVISAIFALVLLPSVLADSNIQQTPFDVMLSPKDFDAQGPNHQILILKPGESASIPIKITNHDSVQHQISFGIPFPGNISNFIENYSFEPQSIQVPANSEKQILLHIQVKNNTDSHWGKFDFFAKSKSFGVVGKSFYIVVGDKKTEIDPFVDHSMRVDLPGPAFAQLSNDFPQDNSMLIESLDEIMPSGFVAPRYLPSGYEFAGQSTPSPNLGLVYAPIQVTNMTESVDFWQSGGLLIYSEKNPPNFNLTSWITAYSAQNDAKEIMVNGARGIAAEQQERIVAYDEAKYKFPAELVLFDKDTELALRGNLPLDELIKIASSMKPSDDQMDSNVVIDPQALWDIHEVILDGTIVDYDNKTWTYNIKVNQVFKGSIKSDLISAEGFDVLNYFKKDDRALFYLHDISPASANYKYKITDYSVKTSTNCDARSLIQISPVLPNDNTIVRGAPTVSWDYKDQCVPDYFSYDPDFWTFREYKPPLRQYQDHNLPINMQKCTEGLSGVILLSHPDWLSCVKPSSVDKLLGRNVLKLETEVLYQK
jgi:hypothetical protein